MKKRISKTILKLLLKIFKPKDQDKFLDIAASIIVFSFQIPIIIGVLAMGLIFDKFLLSIFALVNTMFWRINGGDHTPSSCFVASVSIFSILFAICDIVDNWTVEYVLSIGLAFWYRNWKI